MVSLAVGDNRSHEPGEDALAVRLRVFPELASAAALFGTLDLVDALTEIFMARRCASSAVELCRLDAEFWLLISEAVGTPAERSAVRAVLATLAQHSEWYVSAVPAESAAALQLGRLVGAIRSADGARAARAASGLLMTGLESAGAELRV